MFGREIGKVVGEKRACVVFVIKLINLSFPLFHHLRSPNYGARVSTLH